MIGRFYVCEGTMPATVLRERGASVDATLRALARRRGVWTEFVDVSGKRRSASPAALVAVLRAMGEEIERAGDAKNLLRDARDGGGVIDGCVVVWDGRAKRVAVGGACRAARIVLESGGSRECGVTGGTVQTPAGLPVGRHLLEMTGDFGDRRVVVLSAPTRPRASLDRSRQLALFVPTYALRSQDRDRGVGDLGMLRRLGRWARGCGVDVLGTLPVLATFLDEPFDPSPYAPVSRIFWNEAYLDWERVPELRGVSPRMDAGDGLVDWRAVGRATRRVLGRAAEEARRNERRRGAVERWAKRKPLLGEYAAFRVRSERAGDGDASRWYHMYVQFLMAEQLGAMAEAGRRGEMPRVYLDLPVGVHPAGFDAARFKEQFANGCTVGAPPDALFSGGQNWGFTPPNPRAGSADGHAYLAMCLREQLRYCSMLRIDHAAALHRLYWIPEGAPATEGVYVSQPAEELYAAINIEAERALAGGGGGAVIVGEDLGTVPEELRRGMRRHGMLRMYVAQFEARADAPRPFARPPEDSMASFGTHDTPTLGGFVAGADVELRRSLGLTGDRASRAEMRERKRLVETIEAWAGDRGVGGAVHEMLAGSRARVAMVGLEDLWGEERPQNVPGVVEGYPNWRRRTTRTIEEMEGDRGLEGMLRGMAKLRAVRSLKAGRHRENGGTTKTNERVGGSARRGRPAKLRRAEARS